MSFESQPYDVLIIGYGPVGEAMATALGCQGRRVAVVERWTERYPLPRAVCVDHEMYRMLSQLGMEKDLPSITHSGPVYRWFNAQWKELIAIDWSAPSISGGPEVHFIHQPTLEDLLDRYAKTYPSVKIYLGYEVTKVSQTADLATIEVKDSQTGKIQSVSARYVLGCDGANSIVRQAIGDGSREDRGFEADWLVIDILPNDGITLDVPPAAQWCNPERPTTIVPGGVRDGRYYRRWEFMRLPHETIADIETEAKAWELLAPWVKPEQATMVRHKVYTFRSLIAKKWREGRLLVAGDAAHLMPPFMGQGMCAGLRDDWNLAWKLDMVLDGRATPDLLDTYQVERYPHLSDVIDMSVYLGRVICQSDANKAKARDEAFFAGTAEPMPHFPHLTQGILYHGKSGKPEGVAGQLSPHGQIRKNGKVSWLDDVTGGGFVLLTLTEATSNSFTPDSERIINELQIKTIRLATSEQDKAAYEDVEGRFGAFMRNHNVSVLVIRPDYYVFGGNQSGDANGLLASLAKSLFLVKEIV